MSKILQEASWSWGNCAIKQCGEF